MKSKRLSIGSSTLKSHTLTAKKSNVTFHRMSEAESFGVLSMPTPDVVHERWVNALAQFELWTSIWSENPQLAKSAGVRVEELMMQLDEVRLRNLGKWT